MRIDAFLHESPMFAINRAARRFESLAARELDAESLNFLEGLVLAAMFFEAPGRVMPSQLAATFATTRGNVSHCVSSLEAKGLLQRKQEVGKNALGEMLKNLRKLDALCSERQSAPRRGFYKI